MNTVGQFLKKYKFTVVLFILVIVMGIGLAQDRKQDVDIIYKESLDLVVATVEGEDITLRGFAVYVAHQEAEVESHAIAYDHEDTRKYWNAHTDGEFIRIAARDAAMSMAIHDELFYQLSLELDITHTEEELQQLNNDVEDFWSDLEDEGKSERLGISKEDVYNTMYKIACAEKCQLIYAEMNGMNYEDYNFGDEEFLEFLNNYEYKANDSVLSRIDFGDVTLVH